MQKISRYPKFSEATNGFPAKFFGTVRQENVLTEYRDISVVFRKFFNSRNFPKFRRVPLRNFFSTETVEVFDGNS